MTFVNVGNSNAIEGFRDPTSDTPDQVRYRPLEGDRVTEIVFPEGIALVEAFSTTTEVMRYHMVSGAVPEWVESDSEELSSLLREHWSLDDTQVSRPEGWGKSTGATDFVATVKREEN